MALGLSQLGQKILGQFVRTQTALQDTVQPYASSGFPLGQILNQALSSPTLAFGTLTVPAAGAAAGVYSLGVTLPVGAKITRVWTDTTTALTSGGSATLAISAGSTALVAATAYSDASLAAFDAHSVTPVKLAAASALTVTVAVAALTAGALTVYVEYIDSPGHVFPSTSNAMATSQSLTPSNSSTQG